MSSADLSAEIQRQDAGQDQRGTDNFLPAPEKAIGDGAPSLDLTQFAKMMQELKPYIALWEESRKGEALAATA
jgi:hypothetical protein